STTPAPSTLSLHDALPISPFGRKAKSAHDMGREFRILNRLNGGFPYCPKALLHCTDESVIGAEFYVMERIEGIILRSDLPAALRSEEHTSELQSRENLVCR